MSKSNSMLRLDKYLADLSVGTRTEVKQMIRKGRVMVNGNTETSPETKVDSNHDKIFVDSRELSYVTLEYFMLNKPAGVVSASNDKKQTTVVDLIDEAKRKDLFPVGRLDKDTEGLLIITNDGDLAHQLLSPKKHVDKVYFAKLRDPLKKEDEEAFAAGLKIDEEFTALPAKLERISEQEAYVTIREGKFHQIKRMFEATRNEVIYLKRISMGSLVLDESLSLGEYRELTEEEIEALRENR
ncbi:pseudouridine synthase [Lachnoclostridium phytofermentans]|uniref:Pseudouridine synthase n=1 Tax=Lachnoclostridium phytofermentans (strain ATCC 700394 / DSM 18823 / ISDg) TaxID=357809 RepID=A9KNY1_LACP7|nr:pseudouridine synthase [Lachnoclostridium phytofermentans]ABX43151.1 pseudouridine synthase [Lachnoclostridium phytofermentans ISDg]